MNFLKVNLWGNEIGRLVWDSATRRTYFMYNPERKDSIPDIAPLLSPAKKRNVLLPIYGDERPLFQGLPPFIADSLPDSWGNTLFDKWVKDNKIPRNKITPLYKLMFIGTRGMGALEYEPCAADLTHTHTVDIKSLYDLSLKILESRDNITLDINEALTMQALLAVGTSAGGRQMKAIIAINDAGELRSGQTDGLAGFEYYILKFGDRSMPLAEIETTYYNMAVAAGIDMEKCRLLPVEGTNHFLTKRFDRKSGKKIHIQTLAAINPEACTYEALIATCRELSFSESEIEQLYARMVFNVMANNTDDHNKNFSFLLEENGSWHIAPAYDVTFIFNAYGTGPNSERRLSIGGKTCHITKSDLLDFARLNDIKNAHAIINRVAAAIEKFGDYAETNAVGQPWRGIIQKALNECLTSFGYRDKADVPEVSLSDKYGRAITDVSISVNSKGCYEVVATIDGKRHRRFVKPQTDLYIGLNTQNIFQLPACEKIRLIETLFPD
ncbi:MAG: type II toxin-antitoxin system HipA family toxin [Alloprevotella sp.]